MTKGLLLGLCIAISAVISTVALIERQQQAHIHPAHEYTNLVWDDEFNGPAGQPPSAARWNHDVGAYGAPDGELQTYTDSVANASLDGRGDLAIVARRQIVTGPDRLTRNYTSARLQTQGLFSLKFGLIEARVKVPDGAGLWSSFWMLGDNFATVGWPTCGELDVAEILGRNPFVVRATVHGPSGRSGYSRGEDFRSPSSLASGFHTYAMSWSPDSITWLFDGQPWGTVTPSDLARRQRWVFNRPFHLLLDLAVGGNWSGPPDYATNFPATLLVDWVRVYQ